MINSHPERIVLGFLDNLDYRKGAIRIEKERRLESRLVRRDMSDTLQEVFERAGSSYSGPVMSMRYPVGGFFFKMGLPEGRDLEEYVLERLGVDRDLAIPLPGYIDYDILLGLIMGVYSGNPSESIDWCEDTVLDFAKHVAAFDRNRRERGLEEYNKPYLIIIDADFPNKFPID